MDKKYDPTSIAERMAVLMRTNIGPAPVAAEVASIGNATDTLLDMFAASHKREDGKVERFRTLVHKHIQQTVADALAGQEDELETAARVCVNLNASVIAERQRAGEAEAERDELRVAANEHECGTALARVAGGQVAVDWQVECRDDTDGATWLRITNPSGSSAGYRCKTKTDNCLTIAAQIAHSFAVNFATPQPAPVAGPVDAETPLLKLCGQLDSMKRRLRHIPGTGQNESYLLADDVACYVEEARAALAAPPAISTSKGAE